MIRLKLTLAYDGTDFCGWQLQPGDRTVQGELEAALSRVCDRPIRVHGSGRTDSGVHALAQVAHADVPRSRRDVPWTRALNSMLPGDVRVVAHEYPAPDFHARFGSVSKTYAYTFWTEPRFILPQRRRFVWGAGNLDMETMGRAAPLFLGEHDFAAFQNTGTEINSTVRTITRLDLAEVPGAPELVLTVSATGFLKQMVRNIVGCMAEIGRGKVNPDFVRSLLTERDRTMAPATAPPQGLTLVRVEYPGDKACPSDGSTSTPATSGSKTGAK